MTRSVRLAAVGLSGLGLAAGLAGCAATGSGDPGVDTSASYTDGTYTAEGSYISPAGNESVSVEITLAGDVVTAVTVTPEAADPQAKSYQALFAGGIAAEVVGKDIDTLNVSRVAGSSLTSGGFNEALAAIKDQARE